VTSTVTDSTRIAPLPKARLAEVGTRNFPAGLFLMNHSFETGGTERQFVAVAGALDSSKFRLHVGCIKAAGPLLDGFQDVAHFPVGGSLYQPQSWRMRWRLRQHLRRCNISLAHAFDFYTNLTLIPAARMAGTPVVIGSHRQIGDLLTFAQFRALLIVFSWCDRVVCNSRAAARNLLKHGLSPNKIVVIGNGMPSTAFAASDPALPKFPGRLRVGLIARMNARYKNHSFFLKVAARLCAERRDVEFVLVGDGPLRNELVRQAEDLKIASRVLFLGDRRDIPEVLASLDVSVMPSSSESLSNVILESMAAGVPVVAARVGGNPELVDGDRGLLFSDGDELDLLACLRRFLSDAGLRIEIAKTARQFAQSNFTIESIAKQYQDLYVDLLSNRRTRR